MRLALSKHRIRHLLLMATSQFNKLDSLICKYLDDTGHLLARIEVETAQVIGDYMPTDNATKCLRT